MIDLHTHSNASDGSLSPSELVRDAVKSGITTLALTDHDTIEGIDEAARVAFELNLRFIPGVELEIDWNRPQGGDFHLLGLGINHPSPEFRAALEELARSRHKRNLQMVEQMNQAGIAVTYDEIISFAGGPTVGRPHFAAFLVSRKIAKNHEQAFLRFLGKGRPFYIPKTGLKFEKALEGIKNSGGIAVLAHPMSLYISWGKLPDLIKNLKERGLDGLEAWHPRAKVSSCHRLDELGKKLGLYITAGSDFHGEVRRGRKLGITAGKKKIEDSLLDLPAILRAFSH